MRRGSLVALIALSTSPAFAQPPSVYDCTITANGRSLPIRMRLDPRHVAVSFNGEWSPNTCEDGTSTCLLDPQGRIKVDGESATSATPVVGSLLFDPAKGELVMTLTVGGQSIPVTGSCHKEMIG